MQIKNYTSQFKAVQTLTMFFILLLYKSYNTLYHHGYFVGEELQEINVCLNHQCNEDQVNRYHIYDIEGCFFPLLCAQNMQKVPFVLSHNCFKLLYSLTKACILDANLCMCQHVFEYAILRDK